VVMPSGTLHHAMEQLADVPLLVRQWDSTLQQHPVKRFGFSVSQSPDDSAVRMMNVAGGKSRSYGARVGTCHTCSINAGEFESSKRACPAIGALHC
jgi:hypothetical protein